MGAIITAIKNIGLVFVSIGQFVVSLVTGTINLLQMIPQGISILTQSIGFLPQVFVMFATVSITVLVIYMIVGRSHS